MRLRRRPPPPPAVSRVPAVIEPDPAGLGADSPRLGLLLLDSGVLSAEELTRALEEQPGSGLMIGQLLLDRGDINERMLTHALARQLRMSVADLRSEQPEREAVALVDAARARSLQIVPLRLDDGRLDVAIAEPGDERLVPFLTGLPVKAVRLHLAPTSDVRAAVNLAYPAIADVDDQIASFTSSEEARTHPADASAEASEDEMPVIEVLTQILTQAVRDRASDVHIEPMDDRVRVRFRIDGTLDELLRVPHGLGRAVADRIKTMAKIDVGPNRRPQDGHFETSVDDHELDVRVATTTTIWGEKVVLRLLDKSRPLKGLADLGMPDDHNRDYSRAVRAPFGMVIVSGPTGSGKTTTLYATLNEINRDDLNITTIEDPVEYIFPSINQIQLDEEADITFASGLKSILRQDPNVILVGEVRDAETAHVAVQSAQTGHLVLSSMHAIDSVAVLYRLLDMGIEPFQVASSVLSVIAQRLVRRVCPSCATRYDPDEDELALWSRLDGGPRERWIRGGGCNFCRYTGYFDRIGVFELLTVDDEIRRSLVAGAPMDEIRRLAVSRGLRTLQQEAVRLVENDITTPEEIARNVFGGPDDLTTTGPDIDLTTAGEAETDAVSELGSAVEAGAAPEASPARETGSPPDEGVSD